MRIGCHYDRFSHVYVIFTLPYVFKFRFIVNNDIIHTRFNHTHNRIDCLIPMLFDRTNGLIVFVGEDESLSRSFLQMLEKGSKKSEYRYSILFSQSLLYLEISMKVHLHGAYQMERHDHVLSQYCMLEFERSANNQPSMFLSPPPQIFWIIDRNFYVGEISVDTTMNWLTWMSHIQILEIDNELLFNLSVNKMNIDRWLSVTVLIIRQSKNFLIDDSLKILARLGTSSSICTIHLQEYKTNTQFTTEDLLSMIHQICQNMRRLKQMLIDFHIDDLFNTELLNKLTDKQKKNCWLEYIHVSSAYIELWFSQ